MGLGIFLYAFVSLASEEDPFLWLEEVHGNAATQWADRQSEASQKILTEHSQYEPVRNESLEILDDPDRVIFPGLPDEDGFIWNFWTDAKNPRGLVRRMKEEDFKKGSKDWELILDVDELNRREGASFVYKGSAGLRGSSRVVMFLSPGGGDATELREFDVAKREFVKDGFRLPAAKMKITWFDEHTLMVATDFGEGSMTESSYPRILKLWKRGEPLENAKQIFEVGTKDLSVNCWVLRDPGANLAFVYRTIDFYRSEKFLYQEGKEPQLVPLPDDASLVASFGSYFMVSLDSDWILNNKRFKMGSLLAIPKTKLLNPDASDIREVFVPNERQAFVGFSKAKTEAYLHIHDNVASRLFRIKLDAAENFVSEEVPLPKMTSISGIGADPYTDRVQYYSIGYTQPVTLFDLDKAGGNFNKVMSSKSWFDSSKYVVEQFQAKSKDGTEVPYTLVRPKNMRPNGKQPVLMSGYGGFQISETPSYLGILGRTLLERGFAYVETNIRGGGEFGPSWHQAAIREKKQKSYDDFIAIAEDLIAKGITLPQHLGIRGGSNGGLLMGAVMTQRPDLFGAVIIQVPLLDMKRYTQMSGAGASWIAEYGDPMVPSDWEFISKYSPYQNLSRKMPYPPTFIWTSRKDDRVAPGHARKFAARMEDFGARPLYYENPEGGHAGSADTKQEAHRRALECAFLFRSLVD